MRLQHCTWMEVADYLQRSKTILIPIGSTEQHGPNGLIGTDAICPEAISQGVADKMEMLIAPTISIGMAQHHLKFAGSITLRPSTMINVLADVINSLCRHGFKHFYFLNGHGGNIASIEAAFSEVHAQSSFGFAPAEHEMPHLHLRNWWMGTRVGAYTQKHFGDTEGTHATVSEVALSYFVYPDQVKNVEMNPKVAPAGIFYDATDFRQRYPDGRIGSDPSQATVAHGENIFHAAVEDTFEDLNEFLKKP